MHRRQYTNNLQFPDVPALGNLLRFSNEFRFTKSCYEEVLAVGDVAGFHLSDFFQRHRCRLSVPGSCAANPLLISDDIGDEESMFLTCVDTAEHTTSNSVTAGSSEGSNSTDASDYESCTSGVQVEQALESGE